MAQSDQNNHEDVISYCEDGSDPNSVFPDFNDKYDLNDKYPVLQMGLGSAAIGNGSTNSNSNPFNQIETQFSLLFKFNPSNPEYTLWSLPAANNDVQTMTPAPAPALSLPKNKFEVIARPWRRKAEDSEV